MAKKGSVIPEKVIAKIPELRWKALLRTGLIREVEAAQIGEYCEVCGEGPFQRLARHMTAVHDDEMIAAASVTMEEEAVAEEE